MRSQPNRNYISDDVVQTPPKLARQLVEHFKPRGRILEPCAGQGNFLRALREHVKANAETLKTEMRISEAPNGELRNGETPKSARTGKPAVRPRIGVSASQGFSVSTFPKPSASTVAWTESQRGRDFFAWNERVDWIVTNPPWSQIRRFLQHAMSVADHVVFLMTINHVWTKARLRDIRAAGFGLKEIVLVDMPRTFPQSGFQLGAVYVCRGWIGPIALSELKT